ncbi:MAG: methyltransferase domain-containing protein [candidate division Zixibacteria bacterium]|nr:methyltransferase domain-containing protein [candidate division Zixibacteria bacterium]
MQNEFYIKIAPHYEVIYKNPEFRQAAVDFIEWALKEHTDIEVKDILDCGCGTGAQAIPLLQKGYNVTATDYSPDMLDIAKRNFTQSNLKVDTSVQDVRDLPYDEKFDAVIFIFSAFNHMHSTVDALKTLGSFKKALRKDGLAIFDVANIIQLMERFKGEVNEHYTVDKTNVMRHIKHSVDSIDCCMTHDEMTFYDDGRTVKSYASATELGIFTKRELDYYISQTGFSDVKIFRGFKDRGEMTGNSFRLVYVCRK